MCLSVSVLLQVVRLFKHQYYSNDKNVVGPQKLTHSREGVRSSHVEFCIKKNVRIKNMELVSKIQAVSLTLCGLSVLQIIKSW